MECLFALHSIRVLNRPTRGAQPFTFSIYERHQARARTPDAHAGGGG
jgi:hypothetical protein